jgi:antitoxin VapB
MRAKVLTTERGQLIQLPAEIRFDSEEVHVRRDAKSGDLILSRWPPKWNELFDALDKAGIPEDFLDDRGIDPP